MDKKSLINLCLDLSELDTENDSDLVVFEDKICALSNKIDSYIFADQFSESQIELLKKEREHIDRQIKAFQRVQDRLRDMAKTGLDVLGQTKIKSDNGHTISLRKSESIKVTNINLLPAWAVDLKVEKVANKTKLKEAIKSGERVDGAELIEKDYVVFK